MRGPRLLSLLFASFAFTLLIGACGGDNDEGSANPDAVSDDDETSTGGSTDTADGSTDTADDADNADDGAVDDDGGASPEETDPAPVGDVDCAQVKTDAELVGLAVQLLPQMRTAETITDTIVLTDLGELRSAIERLRPYAGDATDEFLDDISAGADAIEVARNGDPDTGIAQIEEITGGLDGLQDWLFRQIDMGEDLQATGCEF